MDTLHVDVTAASASDVGSSRSPVISFAALEKFATH